MSNGGFDIGHWSIAAVPGNWEPVGGNAICQLSESLPQCSLVVLEEPIEDGLLLEQYVKKQLELMKEELGQVDAEAQQAVAVRNADEAIRLVLHRTGDDDEIIFQCQIYARSGKLVGVATLTVLQDQLPLVRQDLERIVGGLSFSAVSPGSTAQ